MGSWGNKPRDNDSSADLADSVWRATALAVQKVFKKSPRDAHEAWRQLGCMQIVMDDAPGALDTLQRELKMARGMAEILLDDDQFAEIRGAAKDQREARTELRKLLAKIEKVLSKM